MIDVAGIDHIVLRTTKRNEMLDFYCGVLGCKIERESSKELGLTQLRAGCALIDLVSVDSKLGKLGGGPPGKTENNLDHFCLQLKPISEEDIKKTFKNRITFQLVNLQIVTVLKEPADPFISKTRKEILLNYGLKSDHFVCMSMAVYGWKRPEADGGIGKVHLQQK